MSQQPLETYRQRNQELLAHMKAAPNLKQFRKQKRRTLNSQIFRIEKEDLCEFFKPDQHKETGVQGECRNTLNMLKECQYNAGLCRLLGTDMKTGIIGDKEDIERRQRFFGKHSIPQPKIQKFNTILFMQFEDPNVIYLTWVATLYLVISFFSSSHQSNNNGYVESLTIYFGLMFACLLSAYCDLKKEQQHLKIQDQVNDQKVTVYRGAYGTAVSIPVRELVVGDIVQLSQGDRVPADCIILSELNLRVDESIYWKDDEGKKKMKKDESQCFLNSRSHNGKPDNHESNPDFTLLSDSKVMEGEGRALVCAVGDMTYLSRKRSKDQLIIKEQKTNLEKRLEQVGEIVGKWCYLFCITVGLILIIYNLVHMLVRGDKSLFSNETLMTTLRIVILSLCLIIVAIPEGMPLAISIAMAMSVEAMKSDNILIKNIQKVQVCALLHQVCVGKTGTLTKGDLHVGSYQLIGEHTVHDNDWKDPERKADFNKRMQVAENIDPHNNSVLKQHIRDSIMANTDVRLEVEGIGKTAEYVPRGQAIEVGMINFLFENEEDVYDGFNYLNKYQEKICQLPFDQKLKRKTVVRDDDDNDEDDDAQRVCRVYVKGAPETIIPLCVQTLDTEVEQVDFTEEDQEQVLKTIATEIAMKRGHKPISYGFKMVNEADLHRVLPTVQEDKPEYRAIFESDLIYLGTFGLEDQIRDGVKEQIQQLRLDDASEAERATAIQVKMISGDHIETAKRVALECGIVRQDEIDLDKVCMTGKEFRAKMGKYTKVWDKENQCEDYVFEDKQAFRSIDKRVKVIARATPEDKLLLIRAIKKAKGMIGVAGDSIADAEALEAADVGLCMGSGCDVAKDSSDLIIVDNNFDAVAKSVQWGKAMFENSQKFIVFQFTVSVTMLMTCLISALTLGSLPFNVIQMLWINLVMDILAAIALGTSKENSRQTGRQSRKFKVFDGQMWKQIFVQSSFQILVNLILLYFGGLILGNSYNLITTDARDPNKIKVDTFLFNTFFMMTMFNQINSRFIDGTEINMFKNIWQNKLFWLIWVAEIGIEVLMLLWCNTAMGSTILGMQPMSVELWAASVLIGSVSLVVHIIQTKIPREKFDELNKTIGLDAEDASKLVDGVYGKIYGKISMKEDGENDDDYKRVQDEDSTNQGHSQLQTPEAQSYGDSPGVRRNPQSALPNQRNQMAQHLQPQAQPQRKQRQQQQPSFGGGYMDEAAEVIDRGNYNDFNGESGSDPEDNQGMHGASINQRDGGFDQDYDQYDPNQYR